MFWDVQKARGYMRGAVLFLVLSYSLKINVQDLLALFFYYLGSFYITKTVVNKTWKIIPENLSCIACSVSDT